MEKEGSLRAMKLHIGCGKVYLHGWVNVDLFSNTAADLCCDITRIPYPAGTFETIYASHVLEHVHRHMVIAALQHWLELLKPGGILRLAVPNFEAVCNRYQETGNLAELMGLLYGGQNSERNYHTVIFDDQTLCSALVKVGFSTVRPWDWRKTEHAEYDDFSRAYLPHRDVNGRLMSLNIEGVK